MRKILALVLALMLILSVATAAMADEKDWEIVVVPKDRLAPAPCASSKTPRRFGCINISHWYNIDGPLLQNPRCGVYNRGGRSWAQRWSRFIASPLDAQGGRI